MTVDAAFQGSLFANDFLCESVAETSDWQEMDDAALGELEAALRAIFKSFPIGKTPNESQTEDDLIWPVLASLGWSASLRQQNLSAIGREDVPDGLLFADDAAKDRANGFSQDWKRYELGHAVVESKRWLRPLDRRSGRAGEETAPSTQMLRYLRRIDDLTTGALRWGILTNGAAWRLYYQGARSVSEQFFEVDLAALLDLPGHNEGLFRLSPEERRHWLKVFALVFQRQAFLPGAADRRTFHQRAIDEGRYYEKRVADSLSKLVFDQVFPQLTSAIAAESPEAPLSEVRDAALILLYRLLFIFYAEDRNLLPVRDMRYDDYALRDKVRGDVGNRKDQGDVFSEARNRYWSAIADLCHAIDEGDVSIGLPPYNGGLFDRARTPLLERVQLGDRVMANIIDALSFEQGSAGRRYINYRDLGVRQLGSIYERLLEQELIREGDEVAVRPNIFARKGSGSYYTPDDLVGLIVQETIDPLVQSRMDAFMAHAGRVPEEGSSRELAIAGLALDDPAEKLLELKVCDPAMGSGHFLVSLVDYLADRVIAAVADAEAAVKGYVSPLSGRLQAIRDRIVANAEERDWGIDRDRLDDRHIVRRMVLKRCVYGVDKNPMAVELAKVALWLHTFTVGAPLSFLDHHLRCGDSLFGAWVRSGIDRAVEYDSPLLLHPSITRAMEAAVEMRAVEELTDAEIAEAHQSAKGFAGVEALTEPLDRFLSLIHAFGWLAIRSKPDRAALRAFFDGQFGDPIEIAVGSADVSTERAEGARFGELLQEARRLVTEERFLNWQATFPGVWTNWQSVEPEGGFDAVIGNPPWDRMKLQQVEWFATRRREIAFAPRAAERKRMIAALEREHDPLAQDFAVASERAAMASRIARSSGDYPLLSGGDINLNSLFVERASTIAKPDGVIGLLVPSGIATELASQKFFERLMEKKAVRCVFDFFNKRDNDELFFQDVYYRFKFCAFVFSPGGRSFMNSRFATFVRNVEHLKQDNATFEVSLKHIRKVNPNSRTTPVYRRRRDPELSIAIYNRLPVLVDRSLGEEVKTWPVKYSTMFHMANDSGLFRTHSELEEREGAYPIGQNRFASPAGEWVPLYEGKMVQAFDHRAASIIIADKNLHRSGQSRATTKAERAAAEFLPEPRYYVLKREDGSVQIALKDVTSTTNARSIITCLLPSYAAGHTLPILSMDVDAGAKAILCANLNSIVCDFVARTKIPSNHASWYIIEQLPIVPPDRYESVRFGSKTAGEIVREAVLELSYTAHDMAAFAREMGHVGANGTVRPPFAWDEERRLFLRAKLDALFFHLYGITDREDVRYIYSTFPIVEREETAVYGAYQSRQACLVWMNALAAGHPDAEVVL